MYDYYCHYVIMFLIFLLLIIIISSSSYWSGALQACAAGAPLSSQEGSAPMPASGSLSRLTPEDWAPGVFCAEDAGSVSRDQGLADCAITRRQTVHPEWVISAECRACSELSIRIRAAPYFCVRDFPRWRGLPKLFGFGFWFLSDS